MTKALLSLPRGHSVERYVGRHLRMIAHLAGKQHRVDLTAERAYAVEAWTRSGGNDSAGLSRQIQAIQVCGDRTSTLRCVSSPTLVIHGDRDPIVHPSGGLATASAISGARLVTIPGMGHHLAPGLTDQYVDLITSHARGVHS